MHAEAQVAAGLTATPSSLSWTQAASRGPSHTCPKSWNPTMHGRHRNAASAWPFKTQQADETKDQDQAANLGYSQ